MSAMLDKLVHQLHMQSRGQATSTELELGSPSPPEGDVEGCVIGYVCEYIQAIFLNRLSLKYFPELLPSECVMLNHYYTCKSSGKLYLLSKESEYTYYMRMAKLTPRGNWTGYWVAKKDLLAIHDLYNP